MYWTKGQIGSCWPWGRNRTLPAWPGRMQDGVAVGCGSVWSTAVRRVTWPCLLSCASRRTPCLKISLFFIGICSSG